MQSNKRARLVTALGMLTFLVCGRGVAGGLMLYEVATDNAGLANAGAAARAHGPSTIASNPAGLSYLGGSHISAGTQILFGNLSFDRDDETNSPGTGSGNVRDPIPGGSFCAGHQLDNQWSVGFGAHGDFGLAQHYGNDGSGRFFVPERAHRRFVTWSMLA